MQTTLLILGALCVLGLLIHAVLTAAFYLPRKRKPAIIGFMRTGGKSYRLTILED